jgi:transmembrane sensor
VYMEVAQHKSMPFIVDVDGKSVVQVLGTSFNINAYNDDNNIITTLVTGSIKAGAEKAASVILKAGEQAVQTGPQQVIVRRAVDIDKVLAWKNGYFSFDNRSLRQVAGQIERWYDIKVLFEADAGNMSLTGEMDRGVSLSGIQRFLHQYGLKTTLQNRVLTVSAK